MVLPNLARIIETYVPVRSIELPSYLGQLRREVLEPIRALQSAGSLRWFSFLLHTRRQLTPPLDEDGYIVHLRLEPSPELDAASFMQLLPPHFVDPHEVPPLPAILPGASSTVRDHDWSHEWRMLGECSAWVLELLDTYENGPEPDEIVQYLHFLTNPLLLGQQSVFVPQNRRF